MNNFKIGDRVVLNNNLSEDARVMLMPGDKGTIQSIKTWESTDVVVVGVVLDDPDDECEYVLVGEEVDLDRSQIESVPDRWEPDLLMSLGYRGLA